MKQPLIIESNCMEPVEATTPIESNSVEPVEIPLTPLIVFAQPRSRALASG